MRFLRRKRGSGEGHPLERALQAALEGFGSRSGEVTRWVLTGSPSKVDLSPLSRGAVALDNPKQNKAIITALGDADLMVEWRLGLLMNAGVLGAVGPTGALHGLWNARGRTWPDDKRIAQLLAAANVSVGHHLIDMLSAGGQAGKEELRRRPSFDGLVRNNPGIVRERLNGDASQVDVVANALLAASVDTLSQYSESIAELMTATGKKRRAAGAKLGSHVGYLLLAEQLQRLATKAGASVRAEAIRSLGRLAGAAHRDEVVAFCESSCADDQSSAVQEAIADLAKLHEAPAAELDVKLPGPDRTLPDEAARAAYDAMFEKAYEADSARYESMKQRFRDDPTSKALSRTRDLRPAPRASHEVIDAGWSYICHGGPLPIGLFEGHNLAHLAQQVIGDLQPLHAFRLLQLTGKRLRWAASFPTWLPSYRETGHPTPLELQAAAEEAGLGRREILALLPKKLPWSADDTWPWVAALLPDFIDIIATGETHRWDSISKYYDAIACLPTVPADLRQLLLTQAVSGPKTHRPLAKAVMAGDENLVSSVVGYLSSRKYSDRAEAASWLADLRASQAAPALHKAAAKEKHDFAKGSILTALERLGEPIDQYVDRERLLAEATKGLAKKIPAAAEWIPLDSLPSLRWDDGTPVDSLIAKWLVIQAVRLKSPSPSPIVRRFFNQMHGEDVERFAAAIHSMWLAEDIRPITIEAATSLAKQQARHERIIPRPNEELASLTDNELVAHFVREHLRTPAGSASASRGILSLTAAGGGLDIVAPSEAFLRKWYGRRLSQCKALMEMLAWMEDPTAIQLVLSVGARFRTKAVQREAVRQAELLADRKGWTLEDLAYRTVPTAGFDANGAKVIDYGERQITGQLTDDLAIVLSNADGKQVKALPPARKTEDEELVKLARKEFSNAKKQLSAAAKEQPHRLHEAMCVQRRFGVDDYNRYIMDHPVMSRLATRLVWAAVGPDGEHTMFCPLSDGTLLDENDEEVSLANAIAVRLAHGAIDGEEVGAAWKQHYADYEIAALFPQFERPQTPELAPDQDKLIDCKGAIIDDRRLRSAADKVGYSLSHGGGGGGVAIVRRRFPSVGIEARINVRGLHSWITKQDVALEELSFGPLDCFETMALAEVPPVLLVETIANVNQIIAAGDGILEDWEKRVAW